MELELLSKDIRYFLFFKNCMPCVSGITGENSFDLGAKYQSKNDVTK